MNTPLRPEVQAAAPPLDTTRRYVRVRGERRGHIEFDFAIGEPELFVELMLEPEAFADFCVSNHVVVLAPNEAATGAGQDEQAEHDWRLSGVGPARHD
jgi:phenol hydroxylase P0 protein